MLVLRVITGLTFLGVFLYALPYDSSVNWLLPVLVMVTTVVGTLEYTLLIRARGFQPTMLLLCIFALSILMIAIKGRMELFPILMMLAFVIISILQLLRSGHENFAAKVGTSLFGCVYVSLPMALLIIILFQFEIRARVMAFCMAVTWLTDIGAYIMGRSLGRHKLAPVLSPNKTIEGAVGGVLFSLTGAVLLSLYWPKMNVIFPLGWAVLLALLISTLGQLGDLAESALKRDVDMKDSGYDWSGHGGMLDIIDSLIYSVPILFIYLMHHSSEHPELYSPYPLL